MNSTDKILVGKIVGAQGLRGEIRVQTYTENADDFRVLKFAGMNLKFVRALPSSSVVIMKAENADDRNAAEALRGTELFIDRSALPELSSGEFYHADLIGMSVNDNVVVAVHNFGAGDILELDSGEMIPFAGAKVDLKNKKITL